MPISPVTLAAKAAVTVLRDEEARRKVMMITLTPAIGVLLIITMIVHIITMPFQAIADYFSEDEAALVEVMQQDYGYLQSVVEDSTDYTESAGLDFSGIVFTDNVIPVVYYNQLDSRWKDEPYGKQGTIGSSGCGPTALAMAVSSLTSQTIDPAQMSEWAFENGYKCEGNGSYHSLIPEGAQHFGLTVEGIQANEPQKIVKALSSGRLVIAIMSKGHFTSSGHFILLRGVTTEGNILVADPSSKSRSEQEWDLSLICREANKNAGAGGPFWALEPAQ